MKFSPYQAFLIGCKNATAGFALTTRVAIEHGRKLSSEKNLQLDAFSRQGLTHMRASFLWKTENISKAFCARAPQRLLRAGARLLV